MDTIAAISTALGVGAISIIRVSGDDSVKIVNKIFKGKDLTKVKSHTIHYGHIMEGKTAVDEVLVSVMLSPKTFTTEDVVEINSHGGIATTNKVLELLLLNGARLAEPGEFTKRAFLNGRIDLIEADGIMNLISSKTENSRKLSMNQLTGKVTNDIKKLRQNLVEILSHIEVNIDYPEYEDIEVMTNDIVLKNISKIELEIKDILEKSEDGRIIKEGIKTIIIGKPNVGKSSLLNNLINEEKAIVTDIAGTTRDIVEGKIIIDGVVLDLIDTAGIRHTNDVVESIGVKKSIDLIDTADLIIYMLNGNEEIDENDIEILNKIKDKNHIVVINKIDLEEKIDYNKICTKEIIKMSISKNIGIDDLKNKIKELFNLEKLKTRDLNFLTNARSISILKECQKLIISVKEGIKNNYPIDIVEIDIKRIWELLGEIIGETYQDELINQLFSQFCLGK